jgi:hypothetical protein
MTEKEFIDTYNNFKESFPNLKNSFLLVDTGKALHVAGEGDALELIKSLIQLCNNNDSFFSMFLTVGEYLRSSLSNQQIKSLTKLNLEKFTKENSN